MKSMNRREFIKLSALSALTVLPSVKKETPPNDNVTMTAEEMTTPCQVFIDGVERDFVWAINGSAKPNDPRWGYLEIYANNGERVLSAKTYREYGIVHWGEK
jgi:hypothetical protein